MSSSTPPAYDKLIEQVREASLLSSVSWLLSWDQETFMPPGGAEHRGRQMALLAGLVHERATAPSVGDRLSEVEASSWLKDAPQLARGNIAEIRRVYERQKKLPRALVEELARTIPVAQGAWAQAKKSSSFADFAPHLDKIVKLKREEARAVSSGGDLYDALLDEHEPGMTTAEVEKLLGDLERGLVPLVRAIADKVGPSPPPLPWGARRFPVEQQRVLCATVPHALGLRASDHRLDVSAHPFSQRIGPGDVRITTRFDDRDLRGAYFGVMHETGHAMYEQGLDPAHDGTPAGEARSLGLHESQSRLWENQVGRSRAYWTHAYPFVRALFPDALGAVDVDAFHRAINRVEPSFIRTEADEVTYNLHIILRMRIERRILDGALEVKDVPAAWNDEVKRTLGITPPDDARGCLQDVHWGSGAFGYFPTYALGNMFAAQLMEAARADLGDVDGAFARGEFAPLLTWLRAKVHKRGAEVRGSQIVKDATGKAPDAAAFLRYVEGKFKPLYGL
ncbi:MAG TPA: carboxypeptidase M32 [Myxococcota bacterium]|jgi:carboxypeptidase Taq